VRGIAAGSDVELATRNGRPMARGLYDPGSPLALRIYTLDPREAIDAAFVRRRLDQALSSRLALLDRASTNAFRWCNGEGDRLPASSSMSTTRSRSCASTAQPRARSHAS